MPDIAGNSLGTATLLNLTSSPQTYSDTTTLAANDYYRFNLSYRSSFNLSVTGLSANANVILLDRAGNPVTVGGVPQSSTNAGQFAESINTALDAGTYYIRVTPDAAVSRANYTLNVAIANTVSSDIVWRNYANGGNITWQLTGTTLTGVGSLPELADTNWKLQAIADFNGDGYSDLIWRNSGSGDNVIWFLQGTTFLSEAALPKIIDPNWMIAGTGDFNGDQKPDLVWHNSQNGGNTIWLLDGPVYLDSLTLPTLADTSWELQGVDDFNRDGSPDLVWRNDVSGTNTVWYFRGATYIGGQDLPPIADLDWRLQGTADFNQDGSPDLFWRNYRTGANTLWLMNGTTYLSDASIPALSDVYWQGKLGFKRVSEPTPIDPVGNSIATAFNLGSNLSGKGTFQDVLGSSNLEDYYRFSVSSPSSLLVLLAGLSDNVDLQLLDAAGTVLQTSNQGGTASESFSRTLEAGTYFVRVFSNGSSYYGLDLTLNNLPLLVANAGLPVSEGGTGTIASSNLRVIDGDNAPSQLTYTLGSLPANGSLLLNGVELTSGAAFTQAAIDGNQLAYRHNGSETTRDGFGFSVSDGMGGTVTGQFAIAVAPVNDAAILTVPPAQQADQNANKTIFGVSVADVDVGAGDLTVTLTVNSGLLSLATIANLTLIQGTGAENPVIAFRGKLSDINTALSALIYRSNATFQGTDTIAIRVEDNGNTGAGGNTSDTKSIAIAVAPVNRAPTIALPSTLSTPEDISLTIAGLSISDVDAGGGNLTVSLVANNGLITLGSNAGITLNIGTGRRDRSVTFTGPLAAINAALTNLTYLGNPDFNGTDTLRISVNDNGNTGNGIPLSDLKTLAIVVTPRNDAPLLTVPGAQEALENADLTLTGISVADVDVGNGVMTASVSAVSGILTIAPTTGIIFGGANQGSSVILNGTLANINAALSSVTYRSNLNFNGSDTITIDVNDNLNTGAGIALGDRKTIAVTVLGVNSAPVIALPTAPSANSGIPIGVPGITVSDPDAGNGIASVTLTVANGVLSIPPTTGVRVTQGNPLDSRISFQGTLADLNRALAGLTYRSNPNFVGFEAIAVSISDEGNTGIGTPLSDSKTLFVSVGGAVNLPPIAVNDSYSLAEEGSVSGNVLTNDSDPDNRLPLSAQLGTAPTNAASFTLNPDGTFSYVPRLNFNGTDSFTYRVRDALGGLSSLATATLGVTSVNDAPIANLDSFSVNEGGTLTGNVVTNDSDPDGNLPLTAQIVTAPTSAATFMLNPDGTFTYIPKAGFNGADSFTYLVRDSLGLAATPTTANITIASVNDAPIARPDSYTVNVGSTLNPPQGVLANDTDTDSPNLTAILVAPTNRGTLNLNPNGTFTYTPTAGPAGTDTFVYKVSDGSLESNLATVTIGVLSVNTAPVAASDTYSVNRNSVLSPPNGVLFNDSDAEPGTTLTAIKVSDPISGSLTLNANGSFTYTPTPGYFGTDSFTYKANDGALDSAPTTVTIGVLSVNAAPVAVNDSYTVRRNSTLNGTPNILLNDTDADPGTTLTAIKASDPAHGTLTLNSDGTFTYVPTTDYFGLDSFTYRASDRTDSSNLGTVSITVSTANAAPVAANDSYAIGRNGVLPVPARGVLLNDTDDDPAISLTAIRTSDPTHGTLTLNANGSFTYTPTPGYAGPDSFTYKVNDGALDSATIATVILTVTAGTNARPVAANDSYAVTSSPFIISSALDSVLRNDTDADLNWLSVTQVATTQNGSLLLNTDGTFTYTPNAGATSDSFTYKVNDGLTDSDVATVTLVVSTNTPPTAVNDTYQVSQGRPYSTNTLNGVLNNDRDTESGKPTTARIIAQPQHGTVTLNSDGSFTYTPTGSYLGPDSFTYRANDGSLDSANTATVSLTVLGNTPPIARNDSYSISRNRPLNISELDGVIRRNDTDLENNPLTAIKVSDPTHGTLTLNASGSFTYTSTTDYVGPDSFTYKANDGTVDSTAVATVTLTVVNNTAPVAVDDSYRANLNTPLSIAARGVLINDSDAENDSLTPIRVNSPSHGALNLDGTGGFTYTPDAGYQGTDSFTYRVSDGSLNSNIATATIVVGPNSAPVTQPDSYTINRNNTLTIAAADGVLKNDSDVGPLFASLVSQPANGRVTLNSDGSFVYTPTTNFTSTDTFVYQASDGEFNTPGTVTIVVQSTSRPPSAVADTYGNANANSPFTASIATGVLKNDTDPDGDRLFATIGTQPTKGTVTLNSDGSFVYTPQADFVGTDSFTYTATDGINVTPATTVQLVVGATNNPPIVTVPGTQLALQGTDLIIASGLRITDVDAGSKPIQATLTATSGNLTLGSTSSITVTGNGSKTVSITGTIASINAALLNLSYRPTDNTFTGSDVIVVTANDQGNTGGPTPTPKTGTGNISVTVSAGATLIRDINPIGSDSSSPTNLTAAGSTLYFTANDGQSGIELWRSDGTEAGTTRVADINTFPGGGSSPGNLTQVGNTLFFTANDGATGIELWKLDLGTANATPTRVKDIRPGAVGSNPTNLVNLNGVLFFRTSDAALWRSDGTDAGTVTIAAGFTQPSNLTAGASTLYFVAGGGSQLWKTDGSSTSQVRDLGAGAALTNLVTIGNTVFFTSPDGAIGQELWRSDGTAAGTARVSNINPGQSGGAQISNLVKLGSTVYFLAYNGTSYGLWTSTETGIVSQVQTIPATARPTDLTVAGSTLYFAVDVGTAAAPKRQLWQSNGTTASLVKDLFPAGDANPRSLTNANGTLVFVATDSTGIKVWHSDGTAAGTIAFSDPYATAPTGITAVGNTVFFAADVNIQGDQAGIELWKL